MTETEKRLAETWSKLLGIEGIGSEDDFFELGGHSILVIKLLVELEKQGIELDGSDIYEKRTIKELAVFVDNNLQAVT